MATKTNESGNVKNVENFELLIVNCEGFGAKFNPTRTIIQLPELYNKLTESKTALNKVSTYVPPHTLATDRREKAFSPLKGLSTRIEGSVSSSNEDKAILKDLKTITRKLKGTRAVPKKKATAVAPNLNDGSSEAQANSEEANGANEQAMSELPNYSSASQLSYDNQIEHTNNLIQFLTAIGHAPNEQELTIGNLKDIHDEMKASNTEVKTIAVPLRTARLDRDKSIYDPVNGLVARAYATKEYVKAVFGANSPEYKAIRGIKFTKKRY